MLQEVIRSIELINTIKAIHIKKFVLHILAAIDIEISVCNKTTLFVSQKSD